MVTARRFPFHLVYLGFVLSVLTVSFLIGVETPFLHLFIASKFPVLAWVVTALGICSLVFILGDFNACRWRPIRVKDGRLDLKTELRWRLSVPLSDISRVETTTLDIEDKEGLLNCAVIGNQNLVVHLTRTHTAFGIYGFEKEFDRIAVTVDEPALFSAALMSEVY